MMACSNRPFIAYIMATKLMINFFNIENILYITMKLNIVLFLWLFNEIEIGQKQGDITFL